ncbi:MAG: 16S rRNA (cytosine(1402)-N(4))-methyltransferase RsmH [Oscillospiraceae bacterium]|nr:16S rRNA (cytosine(1402)-N(4))-methyltransferase RsmH [Oscillospiraceae bacterium]
MEFNHISVLLEESVNALNIKPDGIYVDCTAGGGGHSAAVLEHLNENGKMYLFDRDPDAIETVTKRFENDKRVTVIHSNFSEIKSVLTELGVNGVDGIIADLGVSSHQLDTAERGFSFHQDAPLDMRMSKVGRSAEDVVNNYSQKELFDIINKYGEEKFASSVAKAIVKARENSPIKTTLRLAEIVSDAIPAKFRRNGHPARKTFQAIRIEVNAELTVLENTLPDMFEMLNDGGVLAIITFHSLEDRIVKDYFKTLKEGCTCPKDFPVCVCGKKPKAIVKSAGVTAQKKELNENNRSRSAKLRTAVKLG